MPDTVSFRADFLASDGPVTFTYASIQLFACRSCGVTVLCARLSEYPE